MASATNKREWNINKEKENITLYKHELANNFIHVLTKNDKKSEITLMMNIVDGFINLFTLLWNKLEIR